MTRLGSKSERIRRRRLSGAKGDVLRTPSRHSGFGQNDDAAERRAMARTRATSINRSGRHRTPMRSASRLGTPFVNSGKFDRDVDDREVAQRYHAIMDIFAKGKINQKNAWRLKLVENMERMIDVEAKDNFKKCSATIAAATTIYKHRVDDVYKKTYRMLSNFSRSGPEGMEGAKIKRKRDNVNTLTNTAHCQMNMRLVVSEVDPMFHKTTSAFDEGGSHGLLLNNLTVQSGVNVIFDSSTPLESQHVTPAAVNAEDGKTEEKQELEVESLEESMRKEEELQSQEQPAWLNALAKYHGDGFKTQPICPGLEAIVAKVDRLEQEEKELGAAAYPGEEQAQQPKRLNFTDLNDTMDFSNADDPDALFGSSHVDDINEAEENERQLQSFFENTGLDDPAPFAPRVGDYSVYQNNDPRRREANENTFFNPSLFSNWTGPEQWIYRRQQLRRKIRQMQKRAAEGKKPKRKRDRDFLNFSTVVDGVVIGKDSFKPPKRENATMLSAAHLEKSQDVLNMLPEDLCVNRDVLTKLFMKPHLHVGRTTKPAEPLQDDAEEYYNQDFEAFDDLQVDSHENHDYAQPPSYEDVGQMQWMEKREIVTSENQVNFAKASSKINIKKLKENIFRHIQRTCLALPTDSPDDHAALSAATAAETPTHDLQPLPVDETQPDRGVKMYPNSTSFSSVLASVARDSRKRHHDISVPFVFMGVLHLANLKTLRFSPADNVAFGADFKIQVDAAVEE